MVYEFGFDRAKATFHWSVIPAISFPAHGLDHPGCIKDLAVIGSGILAAADALLFVKRQFAWR